MSIEEPTEQEIREWLRDDVATDFLQALRKARSVGDVNNKNWGFVKAAFVAWAETRVRGTWGPPSGSAYERLIRNLKRFV